MKRWRQNPKSECQIPKETRNSKRKNAARRTRSVLQCATAPPLSLCCARPVPVQSQSASGLARSKTSRPGARNLFRFNAQSSRARKFAPYPAAFERRSGLKSALLTAAVLLLRVVCTQAQPYSIDWFTIDGGGGLPGLRGGP